MKIEVKQISKTEKSKEDSQETVYRCVLKGEEAGVKASLTLEAPDRDALQEIVEQELEAARDLSLRRINHNLTEYPGGSP